MRRTSQKGERMKNYFLVAAIMTAGAIVSTGCEKNAVTTTDTNPPPKSDVSVVKPDNTAANKADRDTNAVTPIKQSETAGDIKITADIRRSVMEDHNLSVNAQNAKIITNNGAVTLRGVVNSAAEKDSLGAKATASAGVTNVDNQLEIKNP
jgi:osmotically-inducible protein OsmY